VSKSDFIRFQKMKKAVNRQPFLCLAFGVAPAGTGWQVKMDAALTEWSKTHPV